jgi:hypothetical protein
MTDEIKRVPWKSIEPLATTPVSPNGAIAGVDALRKAWEAFLGGVPSSDRLAIRQRSLRRLAVETGIIERLYEVDWGLTLTLVAEGFQRDVIERANGKIDDYTLGTIVAQRESLEMVIDFVHEDRKLSTSFIKELHAALTRTQVEHDVIDSLGRHDRRPLEHGAWKVQPNHVQLEDGTIYECAPPEHVDSEMQRLLSLYADLEATKPAVHPFITAAWLHHRFVQIHPFSDGNGRVARALTLLVLEKHRYAPPVVDRFHRADYMSAIARATGGDLAPLVALFGRLESAALANELEQPVTASGTAADVAHTLAAQLSAIRKHKLSARDKALGTRSIAIGARTDRWFEQQEKSLAQTFSGHGLNDVGVHYFPYEQAKAHWFRAQVVQSARDVGHYADFTDLAKWWHLRIKLPTEGLHLSFVASMHGAGRAAGVMAVTTCAEIKPLSGEEARVEYVNTSNDAFRFAYTEPVESLQARGAELDELLDAALSVALARLLKDV